MTRQQKIDFLKQCQSGQISRTLFLNREDYHIVGYNSDEEEAFAALCQEMDFLVMDKTNRTIWIPRNLTEEQHAKLYPDGEPTTEELLAYLEERNSNKSISI